MVKIISATLAAVALFGVGASILFGIRPTQMKQEKLVYDFEPSCNETTYAENGASFDDSMGQEEEAQSDPEQEYFIIKDGETLHSILRAKNISEHEIARLGMAFKPHLLARDIAPNDHYWYELKEHDKTTFIHQFSIRKLDPHRVPIVYMATRTNENSFDSSFAVEIKHPIIKEEEAIIKLVVKGTLYSTFNAIPYGAELMQRFIHAFAWKLRIPDTIAQGDEIEIVVKKKYVDSEFIGYSTILATELRQKNLTHTAINFVSQDNKVKGLFDSTGKSLEKEFAYSPVYESTATSDQKWRYHPIRKMRIRHNGIDYRGTIGTEFFSIADGEVIEKRFDKNVGNMIRIKHKYGVHSEYFHADTLSSALTVGSLVRRGQKLGTIGRTGRLCTGPHLHMGLYKKQGEKRKFIELSSLRSILKAAPNVPASYMGEFDHYRDKMIAMFQREQGPVFAGGKE